MIASVHNSFVGHFGLERKLKRLKETGETWEFQRQHVRHYIDGCYDLRPLYRVTTNVVV